MRFGRWHALEEAAAEAPTGAGVYQVRIASGLVSYPTGKSAMIHYAAADDVRQEVTALAVRHAGRDWLVRFAEELSPREAADPGGILRDLVASFARRFGAPPDLKRAR